MGSRIHPQPGEPFCGYCHADDDGDCSEEHRKYFETECDPFPGPEDAIRTFVRAILHGDDKHRAWLLAAAEQFIKDGTVPNED